MYFKNLNRYSWVIFLAYICATFSMQNDWSKFSFEGFFFGLPLIFIMVYWSENSVTLIKSKESKLKKIEIFYRDLFIINYSLMLGDILSLLFQYNNSDARGWWTFFLYFSFLCNLGFAFIFSVIALMLRNHKIYTIISSCIVLIIFSFSKFWPLYIPVLLIGETSTSFSKFWPLYIPVLLIGETSTSLVIMCSLIGIHLLLSISYKLAELLCPKFLR